MKISRPDYGLEQQLMETIYILHEKKSSQPFKIPVDTNMFPDYLLRIQKPMDLKTISQKLKKAEYNYTHQIFQDLQLIVENCIRYNAAGEIVKKATQFRNCIETVWGNFKKQLQKKGIPYDKKIVITDEILKRLNIIQEKKTKKKVTGLQIAIEKERRNILPEANLLPPLQMESQKVEKQQFPPQLQFDLKNYTSLNREEKKNKTCFDYERSNIKTQFSSIAARKIEKYKKILRKRILWCQEKIIQKCLQRKRFKKMQVPNYLSNSIEKGEIAEQLNIRKIQMYVKQMTYWIEDNSDILSDYMKDRYVQCCRSIRKCLLRAIKYKKMPKAQNKLILDNILYGTHGLPSINEENQEVKHEQKNQIEKEDDTNYENKMKEFRRMLDKDRGQSTKRDTKIILKNQNGQFQVIDWTSDKMKERVRRDGGGAIRNELPDQDEKRKIQERKKQELRKDEQFIEDYGKKSNVLLVGKYGRRLKINWAQVIARKQEMQTELPEHIQLKFN